MMSDYSIMQLQLRCKRLQVTAILSSLETILETKSNNHWHGFKVPRAHPSTLPCGGLNSLVFQKHVSCELTRYVIQTPELCPTIPKSHTLKKEKKINIKETEHL